MKEMKRLLEQDAFLDIGSKTLRAYQAALSAYESGNWDATVMACAKALEGVARTELPYNERSGTLGHLLERLPKHVELEAPMRELAAACKDTKGLGAHFDLERETGDELAQATLELLEAFIAYTYVFGARVRRLKALVEAQDQQETPPIADRQDASQNGDVQEDMVGQDRTKPAVAEDAAGDATKAASRNNPEAGDETEGLDIHPDFSDGSNSWR